MKSYARIKDITKSTMERRNGEEDEVKKYEGIITKLNQAVAPKERATYQIDGDYSTSKRSPSATKSNLKFTISRTRDERNDKDFLINFMNKDNTFSLVSPNNLHLLSDDDRNKSITSTEKFKNLSDLMLDDRNSYSECYFIQNTEDRMILNLYSILGRKSKELFLEEGKKEKIEKTRILFNRINNIKVPRFGFKQTDKSKDFFNNEMGQSMKWQEESSNSEIRINDKIEEKKEIPYNDEKDNIKEECYFKQKEKSSFIIPDLINAEDYKKKKKILRKKNYENYEYFWDPEIDADTLSNINHNMIRIEDIYNKEQKNNNQEEDENNDKNLEINAEEVITSDSESEQQNIEEIKDEEDKPKKGKILFIEFYDVSPVQMGLSYIVDNKKVKEKSYNMELKFKNDLLLDKIGEFEEKCFPRGGNELSSDLIYRIAIRNDNNEIVYDKRISIKDGKFEMISEYKKSLDPEIKKKLIIERKANINPLKGVLSEAPLTLKKTEKSIFKSISDYANKLKDKKTAIKLDEIANEQFNNIENIENIEKIKNDSSLKIENQEGELNERSIKDLINNESSFSNKSNIKNINNIEEEIKNNNNLEDDKKNEESFDSLNINLQLKEKSKNNDENELYSPKESSTQKAKKSRSHSEKSLSHKS